MNWDNKDKWEIDHITPISTAQSIEDLKKLNHFTNLRPIWTKENKSKSNKIEFLI